MEKSRIFKGNFKRQNPTPFDAKRVQLIEYFSSFLNPVEVTPIQLPSAEVEMNELPTNSIPHESKPCILMSMRL